MLPFLVFAVFGLKSLSRLTAENVTHRGIEPHTAMPSAPVYDFVDNYSSKAKTVIDATGPVRAKAVCGGTEACWNAS